MQELLKMVGTVMVPLRKSPGERAASWREARVRGLDFDHKIKSGGFLI
jgi:hypothetical protein